MSVFRLDCDLCKDDGCNLSVFTPPVPDIRLSLNECSSFISQTSLWGLPQRAQRLDCLLEDIAFSLSVQAWDKEQSCNEIDPGPHF